MISMIHFHISARPIIRKQAQTPKMVMRMIMSIKALIASAVILYYSLSGMDGRPSCPPPAAQIPSGEEIVIVVIQVREVVLRPAVAAQRRSVRQLLEIIEPARDAPVAVGIESVEVDGCPADDAGIELRGLKDQNGSGQRLLACQHAPEDLDEREVHRRRTFTEDSHNGLPDQEAGRQQGNCPTVLC